MSCIDLRQGDCVELLRELPDASVDCVLTDPPYASGGICLRDRQRRVSEKYQNSETKKSYPDFFGDAKDQRGWLAWAQLWLAQCWRVAREGVPLLMFTDWRQLPTMTDAIQAAGWTWGGVLAWDKRCARPQKGRFRQQCEFVLFASKGCFKAAHEHCLPGCFAYCVDRDKPHLTAKPVALLRELLEVTPPGCTVLDPFMGAGSTGVACLETGRSFIGMELAPAYYEISRQRLRQVQPYIMDVAVG